MVRQNKWTQSLLMKLKKLGPQKLMLYYFFFFWAVSWLLFLLHKVSPPECTSNHIQLLLPNSAYIIHVFASNWLKATSINAYLLVYLLSSVQPGMQCLLEEELMGEQRDVYKLDFQLQKVLKEVELANKLTD